MKRHWIGLGTYGSQARRRAGAAVLLAVVAVAAAVLIPGGSAATSSKPYTANFDASAAAGSSPWIHLRIHNGASPQSIGSANITAAATATTPPTTFSISAVSTTNPATSTTPLSAPSSFDSGLIKLRSLALAPGSDRDLWIRTDVPCAAGTYTWKIQAKQSNDFSGPPGNDFSLQPAPTSNLVTTVTGGCKFSAVFSPSTVTGGTATSINLTITNEASGRTLGSANVAVPNGFTITGAPSPMPSGSTWSGTSIQLRNLGLAGSGSYTTSIPVATPCTPGSNSWTATARTGADYTGTDFELDTATSSLSATVSGTNCQYVFRHQPRDAEVNAVITSAIFNPSGTPVTVAVLNPATNTLDSTVSAANVHLTASKNDTHFSFRDQAMSSGLAQYGSLTTDVTGQFITLTASGSPFQTSAASNVFNILADASTCGASCQAPTQNQGGTGLDANVSGFASGDVIAVSLFTAADFTPPANCGDTGTFNPIPDASGALVEYAPAGNGWTITVTLRVDKSLLPISKGAAQFDVCLGAKRVTQASCATDPTNGFKTKSGDNAACDYADNPLSTPTTGLYWGVIPDCPSGNKPITSPCVKSKTKNNAGDLLLTVVKPNPWDASMHGG